MQRILKNFQLQKLAVYFGALISITAKHTIKVLTAHLPYKIEKECFAFKSEKE